MRVLIVSKFYYRRGGDCVMALGTEGLLREQGHEVGVLTMRHPLNVDTAVPRWEAPQVDFGGGVGMQFKALRRALGWGDIGPVVREALREWTPQVVHLHNVHSYLSPLIAREAHRQGCRVVWTMHDYKLMCPAYSFLRSDGTLCDRCMSGHYSGVLAHRCMKGSIAASAAGWLEALRWNRKRIDPWVDAYLCPSRFLADKMVSAGFPGEKVKVLPNFIHTDQLPAALESSARGDYYCYAGRLSPEKGMQWLLEAAATLPLRLKVAGDGPLADELKHHYASCSHIEFLGRVEREDVMHLLAHARLSVSPSLWWENNPMSVIESHCLGTPVVATSMGGIPELVDDNNGVIITPDGDALALAQAIIQAWEQKWPHEHIAALAKERFSAERHYERLMSIYCP